MLASGKIVLRKLSVKGGKACHSFGTLAIINPKGGSVSKENTKKKKRSKHRKDGGLSSYKFVDRARIRVSGGNGGRGCISYESKLGSSYKKRPDGGHGGNGGNVVIVADKNEQTLGMQKHHHKGEDGKNGTSKQMHGRNASDTIIRVPCGVVVKR